MTRKPRGIHHILYDPLAPLYDLGIWFLTLFFGGERKIREKIIAEVHGRVRVLEIFAGTATLSLMAAKEGAQVTALDVSTGMLKVAKEKSLRSGQIIDIIRADASELPLLDDTFDVVIVSLGLHEITGVSVPLIFKEAYRVLKSSGKLVIFDFYRAEGVVGTIQKIFFMFFEGELAVLWTKMDLQKLLSDAGFREFRRQFLFKRVFQVLTVEKRSIFR